MYGNLSILTETELLTCVKDILARPGHLTAFDATELSQIEEEMYRREKHQLFMDVMYD